jgi:hypothetical protein
MNLTTKIEQVLNPAWQSNNALSSAKFHGTGAVYGLAKTDGAVVPGGKWLRKILSFELLRGKSPW